MKELLSDNEKLYKRLQAKIELLEKIRKIAELQPKVFHPILVLLNSEKISRP